MRYRLEKRGEQLVIMNVEADAIAGRLQPVKGFNPQTRSHYDTYDVLGLDGTVLTTLISSGGPVIVSNALCVVYGYDQHYGFPSVRSCKPEPDRLQLEHRVGALVAKIASAYILAQHYPKCLNAKAKRTKALAELRDLYLMSQHGSFDSERRVSEPYFANTTSKARLNFHEAMDVWGGIEVHLQFSKLSESVQKYALRQACAEIADYLVSADREPCLDRAA
jgi:hypothetical protein